MKCGHDNNTSVFPDCIYQYLKYINSNTNDTISYVMWEIGDLVMH